MSKRFRLDRRDLYDITSAYAFIHGLPDLKLGRRRKKRKRRFQKPPADPWWVQYEAHIHSKNWRVFKASIVKARGKRCERCGISVGRIDLHHLTYARMGHERPEDVMLCCLPCHQMAHPGKKL